MRPGAARFAEFEGPIAAQLGLGVAVEHALELGLEAIAARVGTLAETLRTELAALEGVEIHDGGTRRAGIVTFTAAGAAPEVVAEAASAAGVNVSVSTSPWALLDMAAPRPAAVVRASPHYYNTEAELLRLVEVVAVLFDLAPLISSSTQPMAKPAGIGSTYEQVATPQTKRPAT